MIIDNINRAQDAIRVNKNLIKDDTADSWNQLYSKLQGEVGLVTTILEKAGYDPLEKLIFMPEQYYKGIGNLIGTKIPDHITYLGKDAYRDCSSLRSIDWGSSIDTIAENCFRHCFSLEKIELPDSIKLINYGAFSFCTSLKVAILSKQLDHLPGALFYNDVLLSQVVIHPKIKAIYKEVFHGCNNLTEITFTGTKQQWKRIIKDPTWNEESVIQRIVCSDGEIAL